MQLGERPVQAGAPHDLQQRRAGRGQRELAALLPRVPRGAGQHPEPGGIAEGQAGQVHRNRCRPAVDDLAEVGVGLFGRCDVELAGHADDLVSVRADAAGQLELSWLRGGLCGYHGCITSPVWHWRDVGVTVQWTNDHVPSRLTFADRQNVPRTAEPGRLPSAPYTGMRVPILAAGSLPAQIIRIPALERIPGFCCVIRLSGRGGSTADRESSASERPGTGAWRQLLREGGALRVSELAAGTGWSGRHLTSRFRAEIGLTPKAAARVIRFDRARKRLVHKLTAGGDYLLADLAADCGYFDQAHLAREVRALAGGPPSQWLAEEFRNVQAGNWLD